MPEGPQVLRRTEWLRKHLAGRKVLKCESQRKDLDASCLEGLTVQEVFCKGKQIFIAFEKELFLYNHQLMRGRWRKVSGRQLFQPDPCWLSLYLGSYTINNINGQKLKIMTKCEVEAQLESLGPDAMALPYPDQEIFESLGKSELPISEAVLDQSVVCGIGNVAKSEILYRSGIHPVTVSNKLRGSQLEKLVETIPLYLWETYDQGGKWNKVVYRKRNEECPKCGVNIQSVKLIPSLRNTYFCPGCQKALL